jgi:hypothetical protein
MIPLDILKKIRQIELRTNRLVTEFAPGARLCEPQHFRIACNQNPSERALSGQAAAGHRPALRSFEPPLQFRRITRGVKNGELSKGIVFDREVDGVFLEASEANLLCASANPLKMTGSGHRPLESQPHLQFEFAPESGTLSFILSNGFFKLQTGSRLENDRQAHFQPKRLLRPASTCSQGIPSWGFFSKSARRRSSSAACSGVKSGSYPSSTMISQKSCASLILSSCGSAFAALRISVALMTLELTAVKHFASA